MQQKKFTPTDIVREYADKYPEMPHAKLAALIYNHNKGAFSSQENVRSLVRKVRGKLGATKSNIDMHRHEDKKRSTAPYLPKGLSDEIEPFYMPKGHNKVLILSDIHVPYHDEEALKLAVKYGKEKGANAVFINGDLADAYSVSSFQTDPRKRNLKNEIETTKEVLRWLKKEFDGRPIYFALGNHEKRFERYMMAKAPELLGITEYEFSYIFGLDELGIITLKPSQKMMIGNLTVLHGDTLLRGFGTSISAARSVFLKTNESVLLGHCHKTSEYTSMSMNGGITTCWSTGALCSLAVEYNPHVHQYNHGFAYVEVNRNGDFFVENKRIHNGKIL